MGTKGTDYTKIGIVAPTQKVRDDAKIFFTNYFLPENSLPGADLSDEERTLSFTATSPSFLSKPPFLGETYTVNGFTVETFATVEELSAGATDNDT